MNIYLLERNDLVGYDEYDSIVIAANNETQAREIAKETWGNQEDVNCENVSNPKEAGLILASYNAG